MVTKSIFYVGPGSCLLFLLKQQLNFFIFIFWGEGGVLRVNSPNSTVTGYKKNEMEMASSTISLHSTNNTLSAYSLSSSLQESYYWWPVMGNVPSPRLLESSKCHRCQEEARREEGEEAEKQLLSSLLLTNYSTSLPSVMDAILALRILEEMEVFLLIWWRIFLEVYASTWQKCKRGCVPVKVW